MRARKKTLNFLECISDRFHGREPLCSLPPAAALYELVVARALNSRL